MYRSTLCYSGAISGRNPTYQPIEQARIATIPSAASAHRVRVSCRSYIFSQSITGASRWTRFHLAGSASGAEPVGTESAEVQRWRCHRFSPFAFKYQKWLELTLCVTMSMTRKWQCPANIMQSKATGQQQITQKCWFISIIIRDQHFVEWHWTEMQKSLNSEQCLEEMQPKVISKWVIYTCNTVFSDLVLKKASQRWDLLQVCDIGLECNPKPQHCSKSALGYCCAPQQQSVADTCPVKTALGVVRWSC